MPPTFLRRASSWSRIPDEVVYVKSGSQLQHLRENDVKRITHENNDTEATSGKEQVDPGLDLVDLDVVTRRDDAGLVQTTVELDDDLA